MKSTQRITFAVATVLFTAACGGPSPSGTGEPSPKAPVGTQAPITPPAAGAEQHSAALSISGFTHRADGGVLTGVTVCLEDGITAGTFPGNPIMCA
jgi:hypothetical protein